MASRMELETRLRGYAQRYDRDFPATASLERRVMARIAITPRETVRKFSLPMELALVAALLLFVAGLVVGVAKLRGLHEVVPAHPTPTVSLTSPGGRPRVSVSAMDFVSAEVGWLAESNGQGPTVLFRTTDGGRHWQRQLSWDGPGPAQMRFDSDGMDGLVIGEGGVPLFRTTDGGADWQRMSLPSQATQVQLQYFLDAREGWLMSYLQEATPGFAGLFHTTDGGLHWSQTARIDVGRQFSYGQAGGSLQGAMVFRDSSTGWIATGSNGSSVPLFMYVTHDGGRTWRVQTIPVPAGTQLNSSNAVVSLPEFVNQKEGILRVMPFQPPSGGPGSTSQASAAQGSYIYSTADGGDNWSNPRLLPAVAGSPSFAPVTPIDGLDWVTPAGPGVVRTTDGGLHWDIRSGGLPANAYVAELAFLDPNHGWATVDLLAPPYSLALYGTTDGGSHWTKLAVPQIGS